MMMTHRIMLKTHLLLTTRSLRPFDLIQELLANDEAPEGRHVGFLPGELRSGPEPVEPRCVRIAARLRDSAEGPPTDLFPRRASLALSGHTLEADARGEAT